MSRSNKVLNAFSNNRWTLSSVNIQLSRFYVVDSLLKKRITYFVPNLQAVNVDGNNAYVQMVNGKKFLIKLDTNSRRFIF